MNNLNEKTGVFSQLNFATDSLSSLNNKIESRRILKSQPQDLQATNSIIFKYLIVVELNKEYFSVINSMNDNNLFSIFNFFSFCQHQIR